MDETQNTAQTTADVSSTEDDGHADVAENQENETEFADGEKNPAGDDQSENNNHTEKQTSSQNSENARRRREAERQREIARARREATIEALDGRNPYTGREMKDEADVQEYLVMKKIDGEGGDPVADYSEYHKNKEREAARQKEESEKEAAWYKQDREEFARKHPDVNLAELVKDKKFIRYAGGKLRRLPMSEIYEGYAEMLDEFEAEANNRAKKILANKNASPGALSGSFESDGVFFTPEQVRNMDRADVRKNYDKIRESMRRWK